MHVAPPGGLSHVCHSSAAHPAAATPAVGVGPAPGIGDRSEDAGDRETGGGTERCLMDLMNMFISRCYGSPGVNRNLLERMNLSIVMNARRNSPNIET